MLDICESRYIEEQLIVSVGIEVSGVPNSSSALNTIDRVTDVRASGEDEGGFYDVYSSIPGLNGYSCDSSQRVRGAKRGGVMYL